MRRPRVPGSLAVITGGGGAIAREVATRLAALGFRLVLLDVNLAAMEATAATLPGGATCEVVDLSGPAGIRVRSPNRSTGTPLCERSRSPIRQTMPPSRSRSASS